MPDLVISGKTRLPGRKTETVRGDGQIRPSAAGQSFFTATMSSTVLYLTMNRYTYGVNVRKSNDILHDLNTGRFTLLAGGKYLIICSFRISAGGGFLTMVEANRPASVSVNPGEGNAFSHSRHFGTFGQVITGSLVWLADFNAGDTFDLIATRQDGGTGVTGDNHNNSITIVRTGPSSQGRQQPVVP
jgi:hypothetical protein